jgi:hypothetical protein
MVMDIKENGKIIIGMEKEHFIMLMVINRKENGKIIIRFEKSIYILLISYFLYLLLL